MRRPTKSVATMIAATDTDSDFPKRLTSKEAAENSAGRFPTAESGRSARRGP